MVGVHTASQLGGQAAAIRRTCFSHLSQLGRGREGQESEGQVMLCSVSKVEESTLGIKEPLGASPLIRSQQTC